MITKINGVSVDLARFGINQLIDAMSKPDMAIEVSRFDGSTFETILKKSSYNSSPILSKGLFQIGGKNIGYLAYSKFSSLSSSSGLLKNIFSEFASSHVTDLIIDLRYNGGGYVETAEYLGNLILPSSLNGQTLYTEKYNSLMQNGKAEILSKQPLMDEAGQPISYNGRLATYFDLDYSSKENTYLIRKEGNLETVKNVYFISLYSFFK